MRTRRGFSAGPKFFVRQSAKPVVPSCRVGVTSLQSVRPKGMSLIFMGVLFARGVRVKA